MMLSVIMSNYNSAEHIEKSIGSVLNQTFDDLELIVIDDSSTDNSVEIVNQCMKKSDRIKLIQLEKNSGGPAMPRNIGIKNAKGKYFAFLDSDDLWHPRKIELQLHYMKEYDCSFSATNMVDFKGENEIVSAIDKIKKDEIFIEKIDHSKLLRKNIIPNSSVVVNRNLFEGLQIIEDPDYKAVEDYWTWLMIHQKIKFSIKLRENLLFYKNIKDSISTKKSEQVKKVFRLYSNYCYKGKSLGIIKYWFMITYFWNSFFLRICFKKL